MRDEVDIGPRGYEQSSRNEVTIISRQSIRRGKNNMKGSYPTGILKVPSFLMGYHILTIRVLPAKIIQSVTTFSQRQMHDVECLATKLTRGLKSTHRTQNQNWAANRTKRESPSSYISMTQLPCPNNAKIAIEIVNLPIYPVFDVMQAMGSIKSQFALMIMRKKLSFVTCHGHY